MNDAGLEAVATALASLPTYATPGYTSEACGWLEDPDAFFASEKQAIRDKVGDLAGFKLPLNRILVAIWVRPGERKNKGAASIIIPATVREEDQWQGVAGLVIMLGPHAYAENQEIPFTETDMCDVGDWVMFRRGDGHRTRINGWECIILESERGVKAVLPRPDLVY